MAVNVDKILGNEYKFLGETIASPSAKSMGIKMIVFDTPDTFRYLVKKGDVVYQVREQLP